MRHYDVAYVPNPKGYYPPIDYMKLNLDELKAKFIRMCGKANGDISVCSKCPTPCREGKRAIQLAANEVYNDPPIPLYGGKTMIENAREENMRRKAEKEAVPQAPIKKKSKDGRIYIEDWYEKAMSTDDPVAWIMDAFHISKTKAKNKIYMWRNRHPETKENAVKASEDQPVTETPKPVVENVTENTLKAEDVKDNSLELKLEELLALQQVYKDAMDEYMKLYENTKKEYEKIKAKTDILCNALDILNDN